jgi:hypothetical protein
MWGNAIRMVMSLGVLLLAGCSPSGSGTECLPTQKPGSCCKNNQECRAREVCLTQLPEGYCAEPCSAEAPACPEDTVCVRFTLTSGAGNVEGYYCLTKCGAGFVDCRQDYVCKRLESSDYKVCWPM